VLTEVADDAAVRPAGRVSLRALSAVALVDAANVLGLCVLAPRHGLAAATGYAPATAATLLAHRWPRRRGLPIALCIAALVPNTALAILASDGSRRSRRWSAYVAIGGAVLGAGYVTALLTPARSRRP
jgi:hypothetical protein